jgi:16S rRNA (guanine(527)-N(7))-methyltransferase RsmG
LLSHAGAVRASADRLGLVSAADADSILVRHSADSLLFALVREPEPDERWVDVGSGAGFPGLVLACCYPSTSFTLVEPQARRAGFLEVQVVRLGLENVAISTARVDSMSGAFDVATARAFAEPALAMEALDPLVPSLGSILVAASWSAHVPPGAEDVDVRRAGVESPGRILMLTKDKQGA